MRTMARPVKAAKTKQPPAGARKPDRSKPAVLAPSAKAAKPSIASKHVSVAAPTEPVVAKVSKDELRAQVEKLEGVNAALRAKGREANKAAKTEATRISELEQQVAQLEKKAAPSAKPARSSVAPAKAASANRQSRDANPSNAVPQDVAAKKPESLNDESDVVKP